MLKKERGIYFQHSVKEVMATLVHPYPFHIGNMLGGLSLSNSCTKPSFVHKPIVEETPSPTTPLPATKIHSPDTEISPKQVPTPLSQQVSSVNKRTRRKRCGSCPGCLRRPEDKCGICSACMHPNNSQICRKRRCESLKRPPKVCKWPETTRTCRDNLALCKHTSLCGYDPYNIFGKYFFTVFLFYFHLRPNQPCRRVKCVDTCLMVNRVKKQGNLPW